MAKIEFECDDKVKQDFMDFCSELNVNYEEILSQFVSALANGGGQILSIPLHMSQGSLEMYLQDLENIDQEDNDNNVKENEIEKLSDKYLN